MIRFSARQARLLLPKACYSRQSLEEAARTLGAKARVFLQEAGRNRLVVIRPPASVKTTPQKMRALAGVFADAALNHAYRQKVVRFQARFSAAVLAPLLDRGFRPVPADPLEQLEPQVLHDRTRDVDELLAQARRLEAA